MIIQAIGPANRMWIHGTEDAFTLVPNFLITGILAILVSLAIMVWSVGFIHTKQVPPSSSFFCPAVPGGRGRWADRILCPTWLFSTRINKPLTWWQKVLPENARRFLARLWPASLATGLLLFLAALEIAIVGFVPGVSNPDQRLYICWYLLLAALILFIFSFVAGFADDIQRRLAAAVPA